MLLFGDMGYEKSSQNSYFRRQKKQRMLSWSPGPSQDGHKMLMWFTLCGSHLTVRVGPSTSALPTYEYCKSLSSVWLSFQLPSAFWKVEGPNETVTILLRLSVYSLQSYLLVCCLWYVPTLYMRNTNNSHDSIKEQPLK